MCGRTGWIGAAFLALWGLGLAERGSAQEPGGDKTIIRQRGPAAGQPASRGQRWAVVVGVNQYLDRAIPNLRYCVADARLVAETLTKRCGYLPRNVLLMTDDAPQLHLRPLGLNLRNQIRAWLQLVERDDTVLVFFSGHGFLDNRGQGFLAPQDCDRNQLGLSGFRTDELRDMLQQCAAQWKILVLDCCHAGSAKGEAAAGPSAEELGASFRRAEGLITLASCRRDEQSQEWEARRQGLFTFFLAQGMAGAADFDRNGVVDTDELYRYTVNEVRPTAVRELRASQTPVRIIGEDAVGVFPLARLTDLSGDLGERLGRGRTLAERREYDQAIAAFTEAIQIDPRSAEAYLGRGECYWRNKDYDNTILDCTQAIRIDSESAAAYSRRGTAYSGKKDQVQAMLDFNEAIRLDPKFAHAFCGRGIAYYDKRQYDRAIADFNEAIRLDPKFAHAFCGRGIAYYDKRQYDRAIADYDEAIRLDPKFAFAYNNRGTVYNDKRQYDRAIANYDEAIRLDPKYAFAYNGRGNAYKDKREYDRAIADFDEAIRLDPKYAFAYNNRGIAYKGKSEYDRAIADYDEAIRLDPKYAFAYYNRGNA